MSLHPPSLMYILAFLFFLGCPWRTDTPPPISQFHWCCPWQDEYQPSPPLPHPCPSGGDPGGGEICMHNPYISILLNCLAVHIAFRDLYLCVCQCVCALLTFQLYFSLSNCSVQYRDSIFGSFLQRDGNLAHFYQCHHPDFGYASGRLYNVSIIFTPKGAKDWLR